MKKEKDRRLVAPSMIALTCSLFGSEAASESLNAFPGGVTPAQLVDDIGAAERIDAADLLRTISQEVPSAACHLHEGIEVEEATQLLVDSVKKFDVVLDALRNGNVSMNIIGAETRRKTIADLDKLAGQWAPMKAAAETMLADPSDAAALRVILDGNLALLDTAAHLVSELSGEYSNPAELLQADVLMIDISGRQAMLTQKIAKEACQIAMGDPDPTLRETLAGSVQMFDVSQNALLFGMEQAGIKAAPTPEIETELTKVAGEWAPMKVHLDVLTDGGDIDNEARGELLRGLDVVMFHMNEIVHLYTEYSKHKY
ncbi:type IV pili methyl-accepting chemotaxis transducer N-terminal domain-containing protein [Aestuariibius sp. 2305UL40-4]|uniref:type IV pili methyl-accepting chemotaxis transducer N-terminal domain-containing protein n=1 Tax=Aestuariibius violaceus TaxID=3234132 RepID=UPI00345F0FFB